MLDLSKIWSICIWIWIYLAETDAETVHAHEAAGSSPWLLICQGHEDLAAHKKELYGGVSWIHNLIDLYNDRKLIYYITAFYKYVQLLEDN